MFRDVDSRINFPAMEEQILTFWKENQIFAKSLAIREDAPRYVFYEGPPTANGLPGLHHCLSRSYKDLFPRYKAMRGYFVLRRGGWDCHGLPVELETEKELGIAGKGKGAIEEYGIAEFNARCRESVFRYVKEWEKLTDRLGFWIDMDNPYVTLSNEFIESVWWILKQMWDKGLVYQSYKVVPYCPRCGTPLSDHEVALGYAETDDPSIYVKFPLRDQPGVSFLVWTTTPWTLPGNVALAVHPEVTYVVVEQEGEQLILARALTEEALQGEYRVVRTLKGKELVGTHYQPLYTFLPVDKKAYYVVAGDFVTTKEGTGVVHMAPAFGAEDLEMAKEYDLPILQTVDPKGAFVNAVTPWRSLFVKEADPLIIEELKGRGLMYNVGTYRHVYPFCWRCDTPLLYYAKTTWYIETTRLKDRLVANNEKINWYPSHIKEGRFGNWLANNVDWALGRERYWGTPLPVWECEACRHQECIGGIAELEERTGRSLRDLDLHRPYVDRVTWPCAKCGGTMRRVPEVIDCWFDSGAMPVAQWHYPFENQELFREQFPADFICEAVDQTRGWFYSLHAISTLLFDEPCFLNCVCLGLILDAEGEKMSKSRGNVVDPWSVLNVHGADALRWYLYTASPPGHDRRFSVELVGEVVRKFLLTLWNTYAFFVTYANIDGWTPSPGSSLSSLSSLDRWILSELHTLIQRVDTGLANYDVAGAARPIGDFVENLSNWYVRRSRRRFWRPAPDFSRWEQDEDKNAAYATLYECLVTLSKLLAPFTPFVAEEIYQNLVRSADQDAPESVHLCDFPVANPALMDEALMANMRLAMRLASLGHAARNRAGIKLRQPLSLALVKVRSAEERAGLEPLTDQLLDELNVKALHFVEDEGEMAEVRVRPVPALLGPKYGALLPRIQSAIAAMDASALARQIRAGQGVEITLDDRVIELLPEELGVELIEKEGYAVAEEGGYLVGVATTITQELKREGLARELVRRIQIMRKDAGFRIEEHITTYYQAEGTLEQVMADWGAYIQGETLSTELVAAEPPPEAYVQSFQIEGERITLGVRRKEG